MAHLFKVKTEDGWRHAVLDHLPDGECHGEPGLRETLQYEFDAMNGYGTPIETFRPLSVRKKVGLTTLRVVTVDRVYGGPEEGGWYYDYENLRREFTVPTRIAAKLRARLDKYAERCNEGLRSWDHENRVHVRRGEWAPTKRPHYC